MERQDGKRRHKKRTSIGEDAEGRRKEKEKVGTETEERQKRQDKDEGITRRQRTLKGKVGRGSEEGNRNRRWK